MPIKSHQTTKSQKSHVGVMRKRRWLSKSQRVETEAVGPKAHLLLLKAEKRRRKEYEEAQRLQYNAARRERRLHEKLKRTEEYSQSSFDEGVGAAFNVAGEQYAEEIEKLREKVKDLRKDLARHNAHDHREPSRIEHAIQKALVCGGNPNTARQIIRYVKDKCGVVQDWARKAIITLVSKGVPISQTWPITETSAKAFGVKIVGKWSARTSGRVVREGGIAAGLMITGYVLTCICLCLTHSHLYLLTCCAQQ